ncbi:8-amino-7-oxononanoate synthase [bacterium]|nr:8-amino-7-oxononanoate synthase [bacterium]
MRIDDRIDDILRAIDAAGRRRSLLPIEGAAGPWIRVAGRDLVNFCGNDYLGLAHDQRVIDAAARAAEIHGAGAGASRLVTGNPAGYEELESALAGFVGKDAALLFGSGWHANTGLLPALAGAGDVIFSDDLNHASIIDGARLSRAKCIVYRHADLDDLENKLKDERARARSAIVVTESIFSMDGDAPDLAAIAGLCGRHDAALVVDEAHALGVTNDGRGRVAGLGLSGAVFAVVGTFGKALGSFGAFVAGNARLRELLINTARPAIFSTALPPPAVGAAREALRILADEGEPLVSRLRENSVAMARWARAAGFETPDPPGAIMSIVLVEEARAVAAESALADAGVLARSIRPPTVPPGTSRLRLTACAAHADGDISRLGRALRTIKGAPNET